MIVALYNQDKRRLFSVEMQGVPRRDEHIWDGEKWWTVREVCWNIDLPQAEVHVYMTPRPQA